MKIILKQNLFFSFLILFTYKLARRLFFSREMVEALSW